MRAPRSPAGPAPSLRWLAFVLGAFVACAPDGGGGPAARGTGGAAAADGGSGGGTGGAATTGAGGADAPGTGGAPPGGGGGLTGAAGGSTATGGAGDGGAGGRGGAATGGRAGTGGRGGAAGGAAGGAGGSTTGGVPLDPALLARCMGGNPIHCTIPVAANGDYTVTVELGDPTAASSSRVQAELFRIVVPERALAAGQLAQETFSVNVRAERHDGYSAPAMVLDLLIDGAAPRLHGLGVAAASTLPTIFVAGDSTVCDWDPAAANIADPLQRGWAQELSQFLTPAIAVANYADSGETAASFYGGFFGPARTAMRAGDYLFIQFGHNDQKDTAAIAAYQSNLMKYITDARAKNVTPVLFTPVGRKSASAAAPGFEGLDQQVRELAAAQDVALVDLTMLSVAHYRTPGVDLGSLFATPSEGTHFSETGAVAIAKLVAGALEGGKTPLASFVR